MFKFEKVKRLDGVEIDAPIRKTKKAAAYDMVVAEDTIIMPLARHQTVLNDMAVGSRINDSVKEIVDKLIKEEKLDVAQQIIDSVLTFSTDEVAALTKQTGAKPTLIPTGYKAYMPEDYSLDLYIRSSSPLKHWLILANSTGIIDGDYVDNPDNEGEIFFQVINLLPFPIRLAKGEVIGQAKFVKFATTDDDAEQEKAERVGGFGSTSEVIEAVEAEVVSE